MEATGLYEFSSSNHDELHFSKGQKMKIIDHDEAKQWFKAEIAGREGLVPRNYIAMEDVSWYYPKLTRSDAEELLILQPMNGAFLVRKSESTPGDYSLSVKFDDAVQHFKVLRDGSGKYFLWVVKFNSLNKLVDYHRTSSVSRTQTILLVDMQQPKKKTVTAQYDFKPQEAGELAFKKGDIITIVEEKDMNWWTGTVNEQQGLIPVPYVKVNDD